MAQKKTDSQFLRQAFDAVYREVDHIQHIETDKVKRTLASNTYVLKLSFFVIVVASLLALIMFALQGLYGHIVWQNRPTFEERLTAPYNLESQLPPYLLSAVKVDAEVEGLINFATANIENYPSNEQPKASQLLSQVVKLQSIVPSNIGDFVLQWDRTQPTLLAQCLLYTGAVEDGTCNTAYTAEFVEAANFIDRDGNKLSLVMTKFADSSQASSTIKSMNTYARNIGRMGNFAFTELLNVDYFYSATRGATSFTWLNDNWVMSISAENIETIDHFMAVFPLYENNPNLSTLVVEQITRDSISANTQESNESNEVTTSEGGTD